MGCGIFYQSNKSRGTSDGGGGESHESGKRLSFEFFSLFRLLTPFEILNVINSRSLYYSKRNLRFFCCRRRSSARCRLNCSLQRLSSLFSLHKGKRTKCVSAARSSRQEASSLFACARCRRSIVPIHRQKRHCYSHPIINKSASNFVLSPRRDFVENFI